MLFDNLKYRFLTYVNQKYQTQRAVQSLDKVLQDLNSMQISRNHTED